MIGSGLPSCQN
jgi:hypothetical protein